MSGVLANMGLTFSSTKLKVNLKMATTRMQLAINKKTNAIKIAKKDIAGLLAEGKEEKARIRVEPIIRDDFTIEAYEILSLITELLTERMRIIESQKECPPDLVEALSTLVYASDRIDVQELIEVKKQIKLKYGKAFVQRAEVNEGGICNERIVHKLSLQPPSQFLCVSYLQEIANKYEVDWTPPEDMPMDAAGVAANSFGYSVPNAPGTEFAHIEETKPEANNFASPPPVAAPAPAPAPINDNNSATGLGKFVPNLKRKGAGGGGGGAPAAPTEPSGKRGDLIPSVEPAYPSKDILPPQSYSPPPYAPSPGNNDDTTILPEAVPVAPGLSDDLADSEDKKNNDDDGDSYAALQARFNALQKPGKG
mmetsp:Transcript_31470/g.41623  ORF Transcript_31470/g.41623 Transcript_31470/m.41623 type:complete len:366 (+) Transcript_31470:121-1218(+)